MHYFLDIDGVLNKESDWRKPFTLNDSLLLNFTELLSYDKEPVVILSSTWRSNLDLLQGKVKVGGITPITQNKTRQEEIEYYIKRNGVSKYLVLDDDRSLFPNPEKLRIYFTSSSKGLTKNDVEIIKKKYL